MLFTNGLFWLFLIPVFALYWVLPCRYRPLCLLAANILFAVSFHQLQLAITLPLAILISWGVAQLLPRLNGKLKTTVYYLGVFSCLIPLLLCKYSGFFGQLTGIHGDWMNKLILPLGISYYTMQVISYLTDVKRGAVPEKRLDYYAVAISFFPLMLTGPIERPFALLEQLHHPASFCPERAKKGAVLVIWGLYLKLSLANILGSFADVGFEQPQTVTGTALFLCAAIYTLQIYCDFAGYSDIARGIALLMGLNVTQNFRQPYFSASFKELWSRWHISLSGWLRDYIYIPLGGSHRGTARQLCNLLITFLISGLWHGAGLCYLVWGGLHGLYQCVGKLSLPVRKRLYRRAGIPFEGKLHRCIGCLTVVILTGFAWIFFRFGSSNTPTVAAAFLFCRRIVTEFSLYPQLWKDALIQLNFNLLYIVRTCLLALSVLYVDWRSRKIGIEDWVMAHRGWVQVCFCSLFLLATLFFGVDTGAPIYFKF